MTRLKRHTDLPVAVGFGIRNAAQAAAVAKVADAAVVGSALVGRIADPSRRRRPRQAEPAGARCSGLVRELAATACDGARSRGVTRMSWLTNFVRPKLQALVRKTEEPDNLWDKCRPAAR